MVTRPRGSCYPFGMQQFSLQPYLDWFLDHVEHYRQRAGDDVYLVDRKLRHTMRVLSHMQQIIREAGVSERLASVMEIAALLHDTGRFPQMVEKGTYDDHDGLNHAELGAKILEDAPVLAGVHADARRVILTAVRLHNLGVLPPDLDPAALRVLEALRDADKLDALRNNLKYIGKEAQHGKMLKSGLQWDEIAVSDEVYELAMQRQLIPFRSILWSNDYILFLCCWLYDLHFPYAYKQLARTGNLDKLLAKLPDTDPMTRLKAQFRDDLDWIVTRGS